MIHRDSHWDESLLDFLAEMAVSQVVKLIFLGIKLVYVDPEKDASYSCEHAHDAIVPHEQRINRESHKGLTDGRANGGHEQEHGHDEGLHVLGRLCERVFETRDGCKDFAECNEDVSVDPRKDRTRSMGIVQLLTVNWTHAPVWIQTLRGET